MPERSASTSGKVLVAGAINTDLVALMHHAPVAGETVTGKDFAIFGGGKGANQCVAAARSGASAAMLGAVGQDDFGRTRIGDLQQEGIDCLGVAIVDGAASGVALIFVDDAGENRIAYIPGATATVAADDAILAFDRFRPDVVLTTLELPNVTLLALHAKARDAGVPVIVNATPEPANGKDLAAAADVLIVNETEALEILGDASGAHGDWHEVAGRLRAIGPPCVVVTRGAAGAIVATARDVTAIPAPRVDVVDTTGAGDAFCGALAARLAAGEDLTIAVRAGVMAGSLAVTKSGAQPSMPDREAIRILLGDAPTQ